MKNILCDICDCVVGTIDEDASVMGYDYGGIDILCKDCKDPYDENELVKKNMVGPEHCDNGSYGIGKTYAMREFAEKHNVPIIETTTEYTTMCVMRGLPIDGQGLIFLDEINCRDHSIKGQVIRALTGVF